jgi:hypothetical protein
MARPIQDGAVHPISGRWWGVFSATTTLPNASAGNGKAQGALMVGDRAWVAGDGDYVCTATGARSLGATWVEDPIAGASITGSLTLSGTMQAEHLYTTDDLVVDGLATVGETLTVTGDIDAGGGLRAVVGPFTDTLAADQTDTELVFGVATHAFIAMRAGSIVGISGQVSAAVTGASQDVEVQAVINGTPTVLVLDFTQAGAEVKAQAVAAKGTHAFVAGDLITIEYDSDTITNTPTIVASLWIEM